jgi:hypothetical protein
MDVGPSQPPIPLAPPSPPSKGVRKALSPVTVAALSPSGSAVSVGVLSFLSTAPGLISPSYWGVVVYMIPAALPRTWCLSAFILLPLAASSLVWETRSLNWHRVPDDVQYIDQGDCGKVISGPIKSIVVFMSSKKALPLSRIAHMMRRQFSGENLSFSAYTSFSSSVLWIWWRLL